MMTLRNETKAERASKRSWINIGMAVYSLIAEVHMTKWKQVYRIINIWVFNWFTVRFPSTRCYEILQTGPLKEE